MATVQEVKALVEKKVEVEKEIDALYTVLESVCNNNPFTPYGLVFLISCFFQAQKFKLVFSTVVEAHNSLEIRGFVFSNYRSLNN